jgi:hypothetical protein
LARSNTGSASNYLSGTNPASGVPLTMACWFNPVNVTAYMNLMCLNRSGSGDHYFVMAADGATAGDPIFIEEANNSTFQGASTSAGFTANVWHHACGVFSADNARAVYLNGGSKGTGAGNVSPAPSSINQIVLNQYRGGGDPTGSGVLNGSMAEAAVWNAALTDDEVLALSRGYSPRLVRPASLVAYWPLVGRYSPEIDLRGGFPLTIAGTMATADHCRVFGQRGRRAASVSPAGGGGSATGALAATLGAVTLSAAGTSPAAGTLGATLGAVTASAAGASAIAGTLAATLGAVALTSAAVSSVAGTLAATLGTVALSATAASPVAGSLAVTLGAVSLASAGVSPAVGAAAVTLEAATLAAAGVSPAAGTAAVTLGAVALSGAAASPVVGSLAATLGAAALSASGVAPVVGALGVALAPATLVATSGNAATGDLSAALDAATLTAAGVAPVAGSLDVALERLKSVAAGVSVVVGSLTADLDAATLAAAAVSTIGGSAGATLGGATLAAAGTAAVAGSLAAALGAVTLLAAGGDPSTTAPPRANLASVASGRTGLSAAVSAGENLVSV